jgi:hypothetical protein
MVLLTLRVISRKAAVYEFVRANAQIAATLQEPNFWIQESSKFSSSTVGSFPTVELIVQGTKMKTVSVVMFSQRLAYVFTLSAARLQPTCHQ